MFWFLRWFEAFRVLERQVDILLAKIDTLIDQRTAMLQELAAVNARLDAAYKSEIEATRKVADAAARKHGAPIFDLANELPMTTSAWEPIPKIKPQGAALVEQMEREFEETRRQMAERLKAS